MAAMLYLVSAVAIGSIVGLLPYLKYEIDDPVGVSQFAPYADKKTYDYIVVGGGSTGCVVSSRLSEDPNVRVLLLEAGGDGSVISDFPALIGKIGNMELYNTI